ncbi:MAG: hypothetical protein ABSB12_04120 [Candidatus Saccharimonadales bacterium]|jgi:hypothetical protein
MSNSNEFDNTLWDPTDPEQAIEDPFHGSEAVISLLDIPPMKREDGTYYVFGASYICGTNTFDAEGNPFIEIGPMDLNISFMGEVFKLQEWVDSYHKGELPTREEMGLPEFKLDQSLRFQIRKK